MGTSTGTRWRPATRRAAVAVGVVAALGSPVESDAQILTAPDTAVRAGANVRPFEHARHQTVTCGACHAIDQRHRVSRTWAPEDCGACHHVEPLPAGCTACHERKDFARPLRVTTTMDLSVWDAPRERDLIFEHEDHADIGCVDCHQSGVSRPPATCASCHVEHRPEYECARCHVAPEPAVHPLEAHASCGGSGCHADAVLSRPMLSRSSCLVCHQGQREHYAGRSCAGCHIMPTTPRSK